MKSRRTANLNFPLPCWASNSKAILASPSQEKSSFYVTPTSFCCLLIASELAFTETCVVVEQTVLLACVVSQMSGRVVISPYRKALPSAICTVYFLPDLYTVSSSLRHLQPFYSKEQHLCPPLAIPIRVTHFSLQHHLLLIYWLIDFQKYVCNGIARIVRVDLFWFWFWLVGCLLVWLIFFLLSLCSVPGIKPSMCKAFNKC